MARSLVMRFVVFSYNRGQFLRHCIDTIEVCAPQCSIDIYDDGSEDPSTLEVLRGLESRHRVFGLGGESKGNGKHGGLYQNMQNALDAQESGAIVCFIQDDMQLVRELDDAELGMIERYFDGSEPRLLHPAFFKGCNRREDLQDVRFDAGADGYFCDRFERSAGAHYSDVFLASVDQLSRVDWRFEGRESLNEHQARKKLGQMLSLRNPFAAWLPNASAWRGRTRTWALRRAEKIRMSGFHPIDIMSSDARERLFTRDTGTLPVAEDFLTVRDPGIQGPWYYHPLQDSPGLTLLDSIERRLRRIRAVG